MSLLREIQNAAIDPQVVEITFVLRKARVLAARLKNTEFEEWVERELNGYPDKPSLPSYRILRVESKAHLIIGWQQFTSATIMPSLIPEQFREWATTAYLTRPISEYSSLVRSCESDKNGQLESPWPQELAVKYGGGGYNEAQCLRAWQEIGKDSLVGLIETVRNRILDFALQIEAAAPDAGEVSPDVTPIPQEKVTQIFTMYVTGGVNNIATGSNVTQSNASSVTSSDLSYLLNYLQSIGISANSVNELRREMESNRDQKSAAEGWLRNMAMSAATGAIGSGIGLAAKAITAYLGLDSH
jgi:hypothetical protein